jgi:hypothetical protein
MIFELIPKIGIEFVEKILLRRSLLERFAMVHFDPPHTEE